MTRQVSAPPAFDELLSALEEPDERSEVRRRRTSFRAPAVPDPASMGMPSLSRELHQPGTAHSLANKSGSRMEELIRAAESILKDLDNTAATTARLLRLAVLRRDETLLEALVQSARPPPPVVADTGSHRETGVRRRSTLLPPPSINATAPGKRAKAR